MKAIIVDGFISGNAFTHELVERGYKCIHIFSSMERFRKRFSHIVAMMYDDVLIYDDSEYFWSELKAFGQIDVCVSGADSGTYVADLISKSVGINLNEGCARRYSRASMIHGIGEPVTLVDFEKFIATHKKVVVKPSQSLGGIDRVTICTEVPDNMNGMLMMPFYEGDEYQVHTVSCRGQHRICAVWKYTKDPEDPKWRSRAELLMYDENKILIDKIYEYVKKVLTLARLNFGATHTEVMVNGDRINLVEVNFRNNGHQDYVSILQAFGKNNQVTLTIDALTNPEGPFTATCEYDSSLYLSKIYHMNKVERPYSAIDWKAIARSPSVSKVYEHFRYFDIMPVSTHTTNNIASIIALKNSSREQLIEDERKLQILLDA